MAPGDKAKEDAASEASPSTAPSPVAHHRTMKDQAREMVRIYRKEFSRNWVLFKESKIGVVGLVIIMFFISMAVFAPIIPIASERHPTEWQGPVRDYTEVSNSWTSPGGNTFISDSDPSGKWGNELTRSSVLLGYSTSGSRAELIIQGSENGLFGIAPGRPCQPGGQKPVNPCLPGDDVRVRYRIDDIGQVVGQPIVNTHNQKSQNLDKVQMWRNRIYATTADGNLYSFRIEYDRADPNFASLRLRHAGPAGTKAAFATGSNISVGPAFDFLGECDQATLSEKCMNTVYVVSGDRLLRVRENLRLESPDVWVSEWSELWNLSLNFTVKTQPLFAPAEQAFNGTTKTVSMVLMVGEDGRLHAFRNNATNSTSMVGEEAWTWPDATRPDACYSGKDGPLNTESAVRARPRGLTGEWKQPPTSTFYVSSQKGSVYVINNLGKCVREYATFSNVQLWTPHVSESEEVLHVGAEDGWVYEFSAEGAGAGGGENSTAGDLVWKFRTGGAVRTPPFASSLFYLASRVFVASDDGTLYLLRADREHRTAEILLRIEIGTGSPMHQPVLLSDAQGENLVLIATMDGKMGMYKDVGKYLAPLPPGCYYPSGTCYPFGTDFLGRDIFSQLVWGSQLALMIGFLAAFFSIAIGLIVGLVAGYFGGKVDSVLMRFTDVVLVLPGLPFLIVLASVLGTNIFNLVLVIALIGWPGTARIIRAEVLSLKERPYVDAARVTGASHARIMFKHISPNVFPLVFLFLTFAVSGAIIAEASLSFIGLGDTNRMSWGIMLYYAQYTGNALTAWWWLLPPGIAITLISLGFFLVGRAFEQIINPRLRKR
ncbi:MAG TPA: ABC transporter permease [Thermoplasmata archaeon]|nr:ABC transporter permease [Thermoplasmata archaeon]